MRLRSLAAAASVLCLVASAASAAPPGPTAGPIAHYGAWGVDFTFMDKAVSPADDFYDHANGAWNAKAQIPPDRSHTGADLEVYERTELQLRDLIEAAARAPATTPTAAQIGGLYGA